MSIIPPADIEIQGFALYRVTDVTDTEILSQLKYEMSNHNILHAREQFEIWQRSFRFLPRLPDMRTDMLGLQEVHGLKALPITLTGVPEHTLIPDNIEQVIKELSQI